jgi:hypothetical protein
LTSARIAGILAEVPMPTNTLCNAGNRQRHFTAAALVLLVSVAGVTAHATASSHARYDSHPPKTRKWTQVGKATWYGRRFQGHRTASGEAFDLNMLTCAHRTLPIGTLLRVTNLTNRRSIMVRVNDRGPVPAGWWSISPTQPPNLSASTTEAARGFAWKRWWAQKRRSLTGPISAVQKKWLPRGKMI